mmetsp:Transcript_38130/g.65142  ORF Transcript_38130/g.65142 Transcript_38130/m.65142 type:complete len:176 (+) Transcript_38130:131-658(+)
MSWTQVYITGLSRSVHPSDEEIEIYLCKKYSLDDNDVDADSGEGGCTTTPTPIMWAGAGSTLVKRDDNGCCRGFAFLTFYSKDGALIVVDRINNDNGKNFDDNGGDVDDAIRLGAELSNPKGGKEKKKKGGGNNNNEEDHLPDLRLRRQRKQPIRKHPVITSSDGKRTNLGNKTR